MDKKDLRIVFFGTPDFAAVVLNALTRNGFNVAAVFTQPDKKIGRKQKLFFSPVKELALEKKIKILQPENLRDVKLIREVGEIGAGLIVVAAYGKILPGAILEIPRFGCVNVHASLLPKYRGASPVQSAILAGEKETGITLMLMNERMDEGNVLVQEKVQIDGNETAEELSERLSRVGAKMLVRFIPNWILGKIRPRPQDETKTTYCQPIRRKNGKIDWSESAEEIYRKYRAYQPWPGIYTTYDKNGRSFRLKLISVSAEPRAGAGKKPGEVVKYGQDVSIKTKKGLVILHEVQPEGKKIMSASEFLRGHPNFKNVF